MPMILMPSGFWSYVRKDDDASGGHISRLAERLVAEFRLQTGTDLEIFLDREKIEWGEAWEEKIDISIHGTTFFIPIITPSYLSSPACRDEFLKFWSKSKQSSVRELILPILYVAIPLGPDSEDEIAQIVSGRQYEDWTELRLEEENSSAYRKGVHRLATRLREIAESIASQPEGTIALAATTGTMSEIETEGEDDEPGWLDRLSTVEDQMDEWANTSAEFVRAMEDIAAVVQDPDSYGSAKNNPTARIAALKRLSAALSEPTKRLVEHANDFKAKALSIGDGIDAAAQMAKEATADDRKKALELADELQDTTDSLIEEITLDKEFEQNLIVAGKMSRDMREPSNRIRSSILTIIDTTAVMQQWVDTLRSVNEPRSEDDENDVA
ncbi:toll/interleukin-1 receptor domain-containing protein [Nocardia fusca]|uniref:toll/interleukin-1 receptor domain-containing protein n=1 Tax=Nocardia fusca TaxID=941183 RepID=UPI0037B17FBE